MRTAAAWILTALLGASLAAQQPNPRFEVASVKPQAEPLGTLGPDGFIRVRPGGLFSPTHATVEDLLVFAYELRSQRIVGGPDWMRQDRFQINATAGRDASAGEIRLMVRSLLEDRFALVARVEPREMPHRALVRARPDRPLGPGLVTMERCDIPTVNELRKTFPEKYPSPTMISGALSSCAPTGVNTLADMLSVGLETAVIDATGLEGSYYFFLRSDFRLLPASVGLGAPRVDPNLPALSTALEEQLGLKLESRRGAIDVLVIDSVQRPTEN